MRAASRTASIPRAASDSASLPASQRLKRLENEREMAENDCQKRREQPKQCSFVWPPRIFHS